MKLLLKEYYFVILTNELLSYLNDKFSYLPNNQETRELLIRDISEFLNSKIYLINGDKNKIKFKFLYNEEFTELEIQPLNLTTLIFLHKNIYIPYFNDLNNINFDGYSYYCKIKKDNTIDYKVTKIKNNE